MLLKLSRSLFLEVLMCCLLRREVGDFQVCDFGLSRQKHNTFLTSKSSAGTVNFLTQF